jgi:LEA14-like dessication related protein
MNIRLLRLVFLAFCLSGLVGCFNHLSFGGLTVTIVDVKPAAATAPETQTTLTLHYANENVVAVGIASSTHRLFLNGSAVGTAVSASPLGVPAMATTTQDVPVKFENLALVQQLANAAGAKTTSYRLESDMLVMAGDEKIHVKSIEQGTLDLSPLAEIK